MKIKFGFRHHRGTLKESLKTQRYISEGLFNSLLLDYAYYGFDNRVNQLLFVIRDMDKVERPTWLFIELGE